MRPGFHHRLINGPFGDPCLLVRPAYQKRLILFDAGQIGNLSARELSRVTDVFVTHTHIDHFIGFDLLLRAVLRRDSPLNIYGPQALLPCIHGKLKGYAWNLIAGYPTVIRVHCFDGKTVSLTLFSASHRFRKEPMGHETSDGILLDTGMFRVRAAKLTHSIPCLAYSLEEDLHINIDRDRLIRKGLRVGPWLNEFKRLYRRGDFSGTVDTGDGRLTLREIAEIAISSRGQKISYATDIAMTRGNRKKLIELIRGSDVFYGEACFLEEDRQRARERYHMTAGECGAIAREAGVTTLEVMHFSPRYLGRAELVVREAQSAFRDGVVS
ncbi:MAG: hypothetical protein M0024_08905 [Nitrospiraceae bacterium]|nr:hypothetical protein [Nitrospiraceae bacterium]